MPCDGTTASQCAEELRASCDSPEAEKVDSICTKNVECSFDTTMQECQDFIGKIMTCFTQKAIDAMESCTLGANCDTFSDDYRACLENELGLYPQQ